MSTFSSSIPTTQAGPTGYGRGRLWLGITGVGTMVTLSTLALLLGWPRAAEAWVAGGLSGQMLLLGGYLVLYIGMQLPLDLFGGYLLPRRFGRSHPPLGRFIAGLARGVLVHGGLLFGVGTLILLVGRRDKPVGLLVTLLLLPLVLVLLRLPLARAMAGMRGSVSRVLPKSGADLTVPAGCLGSEDEGFTGGVLGVFRARGILLPQRWAEALGPDGFDLAVRRRGIAVASGAWMRGRLFALLFTWAGLALSVGLVGQEAMGSGRGVIELSLWFTLWSFAGLLVLPTFSRKAIAGLDARLRASGVQGEQIDAMVQRLDALQDDEPDRPALVETIFHPIPNVNARADTKQAEAATGFWDVARTSVFLSAAGVGLLGRSVHCNCGRPALWVFLPCD